MATTKKKVEGLARFFESLANSVESLGKSVETLSKGGAKLLAALAEGFKALSTWVAETTRSVVILVLVSTTILLLAMLTGLGITLIVSGWARWFVGTLMLIWLLSLLSPRLGKIARVIVAFVVFYLSANFIMSVVGLQLPQLPEVVRVQEWQWPRQVQFVRTEEKTIKVPAEVPPQAIQAAELARDTLNKQNEINRRLDEWLRASSTARLMADEGWFIGETLNARIVLCQHPASDKIHPGGYCTFVKEEGSPSIIGVGEGVSWILVKDGFEATVYDKENYGGESLTVPAGAYSMGTKELPAAWDNRVRSVKVKAK